MTVHFSIDDVNKSMIPLLKTQRLFSLPLFSQLHKWHEEYDLAVTLYAIYQLDGFCLEQIPKENLDDFKENSGWLKLGFHCTGTTGSFADETENEYKHGFKAFNKLVKSYGRTKSLRLHSWDITDKQVKFLSRNGIRQVFIQSEKTQHRKFGMTFTPTDVCFEKIVNIDNDVLKIGKNHIVAFTHEWCFDENSAKINNALLAYKCAGYDFIV